MNAHLSEAPTNVRSRYPGTRPFRDNAGDYELFFGRGAEAEQIYLRVLSVPLVVQFAKSGLGKTSLLQAALFPRLRKKPFLPVMVRLNTSDEGLTSAVARSIEQACNAEGLNFTQGRLDGLWELLSTTIIWRDDLLLVPVLVFDQFEEVFTLRDAAFRADLAAELAAIVSGIAPVRLRIEHGAPREDAKARPDVKIVISLREDYLGALEEFSAAIPTLFHERLRLEPLSEEGARAAITAPALLVPPEGEAPYWSPRFTFEPAALDGMIQYLKGNSGVIEPFQLQLVCRQAEAIAFEKAGDATELITLSQADFKGSTGFDAILKEFYAQTLLKIDASQRGKARELCEEGLLDASGHRLMLEEGQIRETFHVTADTLAVLTQERLLRRERRLESAFYEISHDRLAESIFRSRRYKLPKNVRRGLWIAGLTAPVIVLVIFAWALSNRAERVRADDARKDTERMVGFLLGEQFLGEVRDIGRSSMLEHVQSEVESPKSALDHWSPLNRGLALRNRGELLRTQGQVKQSVENYRLAAVAFAAVSSDPGARSELDSGAKRELARTYDLMGASLDDQGLVKEALSNYEAAAAAWRGIVSSVGVAESADCTGLADSLISVGTLRYRMGEWGRAVDAMKQALTVASGVLVASRSSQQVCGVSAARASPYPDAKELEVASRGLMLRQQLLNYEEDYGAAVALAGEAKRLNPKSFSARHTALVALAARGRAHFYGNPRDALDDYQKALLETEELRRGDPGNRFLQRELAATQLLVIEALVKCKSAGDACKIMPAFDAAEALKSAEALDLEATATLRALSKIDTSNESLQSDLVWAMEDRAEVLKAQGRLDERLATLERAERICEPYVATNTADADMQERLAYVLQLKSEALAALKRPADAAAALGKALGVYGRLIKAHPDNPTFLLDLSLARKDAAGLRRTAGDTAGADAADSDSKQLNEKYHTATEFGGGMEKLEQATKSRDAGINLSKQNSYPAALKEFRAAQSAALEYISERPGDYNGYDRLRNILDWTQDTQGHLGSEQLRGEPLYAQMRAAHIAALLASPESREVADGNLRDARLGFGKFLYSADRLDEALPIVQEQIAVARSLAETSPQRANHQKYAQSLYWLGDARCGLGMLRLQHGREPGWEEAIRSGLIQLQQAAELDATNTDYVKETGYWRKYLGKEFEADGVKDASLDEYRLALNAYQRAAKMAPSDQEVRDALAELDKAGVH